MALSLGMVFDKSNLEKMIKEADTDGNGEIDFYEFKTILEKTMASDKAGGFGALAMRKKNSGPPMKWKADKQGPGVTVDSDTNSAACGALAADKYSCALLDVLVSGAGLNAASVLLECSAIGEGSFVGVVGSNFMRSTLDEGFDKSQLAVAVKSSGDIYRKGVNLAPVMKLSKLASGCFLSIDVDAQDLEATFTVLDKQKNVVSSVTIDNLPVEVCAAVCFGPCEGGQSLRVIGSSSERTEKKRVKTFGADVWEDGNTQSLGTDAKKGHSAAEVAATMI